MPKWTSWSGRHVARPNALYHVRSEEDVMAIASEANDTGRTLRVSGSGHSHMPLVPTQDTIVDISGLSGVIDVEKHRKTARVRAGTALHALGRPLHDAGLALINQGDIDRQTLAGVVATASHGTGRTLGNFSSAVLGATVVLASGERVACDNTARPELWNAIRLNLGAVGVVTELELQLRDAYRLEEKAWEEEFDTLVPRLDELVVATRHFEFFWSPGTDMAFAKSIEQTERDAVYPLAQEGNRCAWSYEVFPSHRPLLHTEMEYSVPLERGAACLAEIRSLIRKNFPDLQWPVEYRTLASDDVWLSTAFERDTATISVHQDIREDEEPLFRACEEVFLAFEGRPHWGKVHYLDGGDLAERHPMWAQWWRVRDAHDPNGVFLNDLLTRLRPEEIS